MEIGDVLTTSRARDSIGSVIVIVTALYYWIRHLFDINVIFMKRNC